MAAKGISGIVVDQRNQPVKGASVVLQTADSAFVAVCVTNGKGRYAFDSSLEDYRLVVQHLAHRPAVVAVAHGEDAGRIVLVDMGKRLAEVVVKKHRPIVHVNADGGLVYDGKRLAKEGMASNAWDLLEEVPGVVGDGVKPLVVDAITTTVLINGHKHYVNESDLKDILGTTPPSQVKRVEVFYNAPPQYGVNGSCINVVMDERRGKKPSWGANGYLAMLQGRKNHQRGGVNVNAFGEKWEAEVGFAMGNTSKIYTTRLVSNHEIDGQTTRLAINSRRPSWDLAKQLKLKFNYDFSKDDKLSFFYVVKPDKPSFDISSEFNADATSTHKEQSGQEGDKCTHTANLEYHHKDMELGTDYVFFKVDRLQYLNRPDETDYHMQGATGQKACHGNLYLNNSHKLGTNKLSYGLSAEWQKADNYYRNTWSDGAPIDDTSADSKQREWTLGGFAGWTQKFGKTGTLTANLKTQYFRSEIERDGKKQTLWNALYFFPNLTYTHVLSPVHKLILSFSSQRTYPTYAQTSTTRIYADTYIYQDANPALKPYTTYEANLNCILNNRYILGLYAIMQPKRIEQAIYQDPEQMEARYVYINMAASDWMGIRATIPIQWAPRLNTKVTCKAYYNHKKGALEEFSIVRHFLGAQVIMATNATLNKAKTLTFQLVANFRTKEAHVLGDLAPRLGLGANLSWTPKGTGLSVVLKASDLLDNSTYDENVHWGRLNYKLWLNSDTRIVNLTVRYNLKDYKQKQERKIDTSRMGL